MAQTVCTEDLEHIADDIVDKATAGSNIANDSYVQLRACVMESLRQHSARLVDMVRDQIASDKSHDDIQSHFNHMDDYLTQCYRQRNIQLTQPSEITTVDNPSTHDDHVRVLHVLSGVLNKDLRLQGTTVLDTLIQGEDMSEDGKDSILARPTKRGQNAAFVTYCKRFTSHGFQTRVLPALKQSNDSVNANLAKDIEEELAIPIAYCPPDHLCPFCKIQEKVNLRQLADRLYENQAITDPLRDDLSSLSLSNEYKWNLLMSKVKKQKFLNALQGIYPDLYTELQMTPLTKMVCACDEDCTQNGDSVETVEEDESTSTWSDLSDEIFEKPLSHVMMSGQGNIRVDNIMIQLSNKPLQLGKPQMIVTIASASSDSVKKSMLSSLFRFLKQAVTRSTDIP